MFTALFNNVRFRRFIYFFPFQLLVLHFKKNHILLLFWVVMFGFVTQSMMTKYGIPYLFLDPEYLGKVGFWSYLILGITSGAFIMAYNISSYISNSFRFPFLATLSRPFWKYCVNNSIIPLFFLLVYCRNIGVFLAENEFEPVSGVVVNIAGFLLGNTAFLALAFAYFFGTNKDLFKMFGVRVENEEAGLTAPSPRASQESPFRTDKEWVVETYLSSPFRIRLSRQSRHYDRSLLLRVFRQNHLNAAIFEFILIAILIVLGLFREVAVFMIPAGASIILLFTMFLMLTNALRFWLRGWSLTIYLLLFLFINHIAQYEFFNPGNKAYGLNYAAEPKPVYSADSLRTLRFNQEMYESDAERTIQILNNWRRKNAKYAIERQKKPWFVVISTSGGGLRSSVWSFRAIQYADSLLNGQLLPHTMLITGSSGGMVGAAYLRELYLQHQLGNLPSYHADTLCANIASDILNPMAFSVAVNDFFLRMQEFEYEGHRYRKDRGHAFEQQLNANTGHIMDKRLKDYAVPEFVSHVPMMIFTPAILNDGRRLYISSQPVSYLASTPPRDNLHYLPLAEGIEFTRFFETANAMNLRFTSALRMNASFPYITPIVSLPSDPPIQVMDAGLRDNFGIKTSLKFIYTFRNWIATNTSGIIIVQVRDRHKEFEIDQNPRGTLIENVLSPLGRLYGTLFTTQDIDHDQLLQYASKWFSSELHVIDLQMNNEKDDKVSLSWHLTSREKQKIMEGIYDSVNTEALKRLRELMEQGASQ